MLFCCEAPELSCGLLITRVSKDSFVTLNCGAAVQSESREPINFAFTYSL